MSFLKGTIGIVLAAGMAVIPVQAATAKKAASGHKHTKHAAAAKVTRLHGQQAIAPERAAAIQAALIREHYLTGEPTGKWDAETQAALVKFQADQGWQTKITPDSRALIKLGLGPDHSNAINSASESHFNAVTPGSAAPADPQSQGLVAASGISH